MKDDPRYDALAAIEDHSDSATEVDDWEAEHSSNSRRRTIWQRVTAWRWVMEIGLLLVILGLLVEKRWMHQKGHTYELAGDLTGFAPTFSQQIVSFKPDPIFVPEEPTEFWSNETQKAWLDIVPGRLNFEAILANNRLTFS